MKKKKRISTDLVVAATIFICLSMLLAFGLYDKANGEQKAVTKQEFAISGWATSENSGPNVRTFAVTKDYDTNNSGNHRDTFLVADSTKINVWGYDNCRLQYKVEIHEYSDNNCSVWVDWVWGDGDTSRVMPSFAGLVTGIDSTYDSSFVINSYFTIDSTMFMDWLGMRVVVAMHNWKASGADSSMDSYNAVRITEMKARLRNE